MVTDRIPVCGRIAVGQDISVPLLRGAGAAGIRERQGVFRKGVPEFRKHMHIVLHRRPLQAEAAVLPVPVLFDAVDVFIRKVDAAAESDFSVDDQDFTMVPVIQRSGKEKPHGVKGNALDISASQILCISRRQRGQAAEIVIDDPNIHAAGSLLNQCGEHGLPHFAL